MENLNNYTDAYSKNFEFFDENIWYLSHYSKRMCKTIREDEIGSVLSLGLGHQVVVGNLEKEKKFGLRRHLILDGSDDLIASFKKEYPENDSEIIHTYFENFESSERFDAIEMGFVLEHVDDPDQILSLYRKYLKPDGKIFVAVPNAKSLHRLIGHHAGMLDDMYKLGAADLQLGHKRYFDLETISECIERNGYKIDKEMGLMLKPITGQQIKELNWDQNVISALFKIGEAYPEIANCIYLEARNT